MTEPNSFEPEVYRFGDLCLDLPSRRLTRGEVELALPPKAFEMLRLLVSNAPRAMTRTELLDSIWKDAIVEEGSLSWNVSVLRKTIGDEDARIVQTVRGYGYRLGLPVERDSGRRGTPAAARQSTVRPPNQQDSEPPRAGSPKVPRQPESISEPPLLPTAAPHGVPRARVLRTLAGNAIVVSIAAVLVVLALALRDSRGSRTESSGTAGDRPMLAVLPFENLSARPENAWIATALSELLANELALGGSAVTIPGQSVAEVARDLGLAVGSGISVASIERLRSRLGFDLLVTGSYLVVGDPATLRIDFRLEDAGASATRRVWSAQARLDELPHLISRAGSDLRRQLDGHSPPPVTSSSASVPADALRLYAEALDLRRAFKLPAARARLAEAVALAPDFVVARAAGAEIDGELGHHGRAVSESRLALAGVGRLSAIERLPIEARNLELDGRWAEAADRWRQAVDLAGGAIEPALALARAESRGGRHDAARAIIDELAGRPAPVGTDPRILLERGWVERFGQRFDAMRVAGLAAVSAGRRLESDYVVVEGLSIVAWADLTLDAHERGLVACTEGEAIAARLGHQRLQSRHAGLCGWLELNLGHVEAAERWFRKGLAVAEASGDMDQQGGALGALGWVEAGEGRLEAAIAMQERALELRREASSLEGELNSALNIARIEVRLARLESAERRALESLARARAMNNAHRIALAHHVFGTVRRLRGDAAGALAAAEEAVRAEPRTTVGRRADLWFELARAALYAGRPERALEACDEIERGFAAERPGDEAPWLAAVLAGRAEFASGRGEAARARLADAVRRRAAANERRPDPVALLDLAELHATLGERDTAEAIWRAVADDPTYREELSSRLVARYRYAESTAARNRDEASRAALSASAAAAETVGLGFLVGHPR